MNDFETANKGRIFQSEYESLKIAFAEVEDEIKDAWTKTDTDGDPPEVREALYNEYKCLERVRKRIVKVINEGHAAQGNIEAKVEENG